MLGGATSGCRASGGDLAGLWQQPEWCWLSSPLHPDFSLFSYNNGVVMTSCRELDSTRSALSAASAFAIATAGANEGTPTKEKYRRMSLASAGTLPWGRAFGVLVLLGSAGRQLPPGSPEHPQSSIRLLQAVADARAPSACV